ncbi:MAG: peptidylprolyl isomerase [Gammaproteobacteria bacterium]|nr:peptidylprolyl isomerase [Gammaproteobacteria bacterium]
MKKWTLLAAFCGLGLLLGCSQEDTQAETVAADTQRSAVLPVSKNTPSATEQLDENTLLTVNGEPVTKIMYGIYFQDRMRTVPNAQNTPEMQVSILNELANVLLVAQDAEKKQLDQRPDVAATLALLRAKLLTQTALQEYTSANQPDEQAIQSIYDAEYASKSSTEFKARHILVKEEAQAKSLISQLDEGGDFAELAKQHSTGPTGKNGGDLGWFDSDQMVKPFSDAVKAMELGKYSKTPVQTQFGWHVILLEESRETPPPTLDQVKAEITNRLQQQALADYMKELREKSSLQFNEKAGLKKKEPEPKDS